MTLLPPYESIAVIVRQKKKSFADLFSLGRHGHRFYLFFIRSPSLLSFASFHSDCISITPSPTIAITFPHRGFFVFEFPQILSSLLFTLLLNERAQVA